MNETNLLKSNGFHLVKNRPKKSESSEFSANRFITQRQNKVVLL